MLQTQVSAPSPVAGACPKCEGSGKFIGYIGRIVGDCFACKGSGQAHLNVAPIVLAEGATDRLMDCFSKASAAGLKRPAMRFESFAASLAPATGKNPGAVYCKAEQTYLGKIQNGQFFASRDCSAESRASVANAMTDPLAAAIAYGRRTGACSCCGRTLSDPVSVNLGIGPICKAKFGL